jgi:hypothetical protein
MNKQYDIIIGVDPGVNTGLAVISVKDNKFIRIQSYKIHEALYYARVISQNSNVLAVIEDARQRKWFGNNANAKQQGAGSIKRDCKIWEDFLIDQKIDYEMIHPIKGSTKIDSKLFKKITSWEKQTNEHSRDAAMLIKRYLK